MKKLLLILILSPLVSLGQTNPAANLGKNNPDKYTIKDNSGNKIGTLEGERKSFQGWDYTAAARAQAEGQKANATAPTGGSTPPTIIAASAAKSESSTKIKTTLNVDLKNFTHIALIDARMMAWTQGYGYVPYRRKASFNGLASALSFSELTVLNPREVDKKKWKKNSMFLKETKDPNWLYVYYIVNAQGVDLNSNLMVRDSKNNLLYSASHTNVSTTEAMSIFENMDINSNDVEKEVIGRDEAIKRIKEAKDLFDSGILSQEEYDELVAKYKAIIMGN
ncbi:SHOCT domain-containing protein [Flavobacteriaceae bacterium]|nr:SHOCT domain-containing protein [Flavobacteriaceae bacterium]